MAARVNSNGDAWLTQSRSGFALPLLLLAAALSAGLIFYAIDNWLLAGGFASTVLKIGRAHV